MNFIKDEMEKLENENINEFNKDIYIMKKNTLNNKIGTDDFNEKFSLTANFPQKTNYLSISMKNPSLASSGINNLKISKNFSLSRTLRKPLNYDKIINFNFGSKKPAKLKIISTSVLTANPSEKINRRLSIKNRGKDKTSTFNKKAKKNKSQNKFNVGSQMRNIALDNDKNKKVGKLNEHKSITKNNGLLKLPLLSNILNKTKVEPKISYKKIDDEEMLIQKYIDEKDYNKINDILKKDNENMNQLIEEKLKSLDETIKKNNLKRPNEDTQEGLEVLYKKYNDIRGKKYNIITNRTLDTKYQKEDLINIHTLEEIEYYHKNKLNNVLLDVKGNPRYIISIDDDDNKKEEILTEYELISLTNQANRKVERLFPDLCTFHLPKILRQNKEYTIKLLYDVFIEFKTLLKCCMIHNRNLKIHKKGIDFDTFYNCNTKINQQGIALSRKIFKAFNNKTNVNYMPWQNYMDGMMKIKDPNIDNKLDLFFQILDENGDGSFDYNEVYNLSLISLQRVLPETKTKDTSKESENEKSKENEENKDNKEDKKTDEEVNITNILAEFLTKYVFQLVGIDCDGEIPIDLLREKMDERNEESEYLEFFLCADNFA
jgi:hypothetical protein